MNSISTSLPNESNPFNVNDIKKTYNFIRKIKKKEAKKDDLGSNDEQEIVLSFNLILYEKEIQLKVKEIKDNLKTESSFYEKKYDLKELTEISSYFSILKTLEKIYESMKKNFEKNKESVSLEKSNLIIKFSINLDVMEEDIILNIHKKEISSSDEMKNIKDSVYFLNKEKNNLQEEIAVLKEKENSLNNTVNDLQKELKEISKYIKEKLNPDEEEEKELKKYYCIREIRINTNEIEKEEDEIIKMTPGGKDDYIDIFTIAIYIYLYKDKLKIKINEIQDNLKSNPLVYESNFFMDDFKKISEYYIQFGGIEIIYKFLCELFEKRKDTLEKKRR